MPNDFSANGNIDRLELLHEATEGANAEYIENVTHLEDQGGADSAAVEFSILFSWINELIQPANDNSWLKQRLHAIAYRGGPRNKLDEAYLRLKLDDEHLDAVTAIIREKQLEVANGFFGIHSGSYNFEFEPMPRLRFTMHYGIGDEDFEVTEWKELPNAIDEFFFRYTSDAKLGS